jgi:dipeptidyl aminopeptidase/acylaminoacyl peptidase
MKAALRHTLAGLVCIITSALLAVPSAIAANFPTDKAVAYFAKADSFLDAELSASGNHFSLVRMEGDHSRLEVFALKAGVKSLKFSADMVPGLYNWHVWLDDSRILTSITLIDPGAPGLKAPTRRRKKSQSTGLSREIQVHDINAGTSKTLLNFPLNIQVANGSDHILHRLPEDPDHVLISYAPDGGYYPGVYKLNTQNGTTTETETPQKPFDSWSVDLKGNLRLAHGWGDDHYEVKVKPTAGDDWQSLTGNKLFADGRFGIIGFTDDGRSLYVRSSLGKGRSTIYRFDMKRKAIREKIFEHPQYDAGTLITRDGGKTLVAATYVDEKLRFKYFNDKYENYRKSVTAKLTPGLDFFTVSYNKENDKSLIYSTSTTTPGSLYLYDEKTDILSPLILAAPPADLKFAPMKSVSYFSRDGIEIPAFLTLPLDFDPKHPGPAILMPHGGPWVRDRLSFDAWVQFLASQGYAVLQPNYRGSTGYGDSFEIRGYGEWGKAMQTDLDDGADWLISEGYADKGRICMVGGSYGGYAALAATTIKGFAYRCAVAFAPVADLTLWLTAASTSKAELKSLQRRTVGGTKKKLLKKVSPAFLARKATMPLLIAHGTSDIRVSPEHSRRMVKAMQKAKKPFQQLWFDGGSHFLMQAKHRQIYFTELAKFLAQHTQ